MREKRQMRLQMDCANYLRDNPHFSMTLDGLALQMGVRPEQLETVLVRLVTLSILEETVDGTRTLYRYNLPKLTTPGDFS